MTVFKVIGRIFRFLETVTVWTFRFAIAACIGFVVLLCVLWIF